jgi:hypothetical protein
MHIRWPKLAWNGGAVKNKKRTLIISCLKLAGTLAVFARFRGILLRPPSDVDTERDLPTMVHQ